MPNTPGYSSRPRPASAHRNPDNHPFVACLALVVAVLVFCGAAWHYVDAQEKEHTWLRAQGCIADIVIVRNSGVGGGGASRGPQFTFTAADGCQHTVTVGGISGVYHGRPGESMEVLYPEQEPWRAIPHRFMYLYGQSITLTFLGCLFAAVGVVKLRRWRR